MIGVDVGGTFTDFCAMNAQTLERRLWKRSSTPSDPADAIIQGLHELARECDVPLESVVQFGHGTTVGTNALIQRAGAEVALLTTRGFRDLVEIGRQTRPHLYDLHHDNPPPLTPRERRFEVLERIGAGGEIVQPIDPVGLEAAIDAIAQSGATAVSVCFLFSFLNPDHERIAAERIRSRLPGLAVSLSSEVRPEFREYERFTTTIINSYLQPVLDRYLSRLDGELHALMPRARIWINQSNGGAMSLPEAKRFPVRAALSGPAAGVVGAIDVAKSAGHPNVITIDIGGTSADVALIKDYRAEMAQGRDVDGFPVRLPMIDITTIGAGGGSKAWFDRDGLLKVGPASAGAMPGPACYGFGGTDATVSDANLVLGRLSTRLAGGGLALDLAAARAAVARIAEPMKKSVEQAASGIIAIAVANMVRAIRTISVERGYDPRDFTLMPFGGAGPLHARDIAATLQMRQILVPAAPGIICAQGLLRADVRNDFVSPIRAICDETLDTRLRETVEALSGPISEWLKRENVASRPTTFELSFEARYVGQNFEIPLLVATATSLADLALPAFAQVREAFFAAHDRAYGFHDDEGAVELVTCRIAVSAAIAEQPTAVSERSQLPQADASTGRRSILFDGANWIEATVYQRADLTAGMMIKGPALIAQMDATTPIYPGDVAEALPDGSLLITVGADAASGASADSKPTTEPTS
ncbi:MAG: hydantoinase/oxoprolinase family protein [Lautropia sp.]